MSVRFKAIIILFTRGVSVTKQRWFFIENERGHNPRLFKCHFGSLHGNEGFGFAIWFNVLCFSIFLSNALEVIQIINGSCDWLIDTILQDIQGLIKYSEFTNFSHIPRSFNGIAHNFTKKTYIDSPNVILTQGVVYLFVLFSKCFCLFISIE